MLSNTTKEVLKAWIVIFSVLLFIFWASKYEKTTTNKLNMTINGTTETQVPVLNCPGGIWDYVENRDASIRNIANTITLESWIYWKGNLPKKSQQVICVKGEVMKTWSHCLAITDGKVTYKTRNSDLIDPSGKTVPQNKWTHIAISVDTRANKTTFYINGENNGYVSSTYLEQFDVPFYVGGYWPTWGLSATLHSAPFNGQIGELKIWKTCRTDTEIKNNYNIILTGKESGLVAYFKGLNDVVSGKVLLTQHVYWHDQKPADVSKVTVVNANLPLVYTNDIPPTPPPVTNVYNKLPVPADYDGDGKTDLGTFDQINGMWQIIKSSNLKTQNIQWGWSETKPVPADYDGDGKANIAVYWAKTDQWFINTNGF